MAHVIFEQEPILIKTNEHCFKAEFHPREPLLATATITGAVELYKLNYEETTSELLRSLPCHKESCRVARFLSGGSSGSTARAGAASGQVASTSASKFSAVTDIETGAKVWKAKMKDGGTAMQVVDAHRFVVGDDSGGIRMFDTRQPKAVLSYSENADTISDFSLAEDGETLVTASADGYMSVYDLKRSGTKGLVAMSDFLEDEYLCCEIVNHGKRVICGSQLGPLAIFKWNDFGDYKDRLKGHPSAVDCMVKVAEDAILTGCGDGHIRAVGVFHKKHKNTIVGLVAENGDYPVECLALAPDQEHYVSVTHSQPAVRVWSMDVTRKVLSGEISTKFGGEDAVSGTKRSAEGDVDSDDDSDDEKKKEEKAGDAEDDSDDDDDDSDSPVKGSNKKRRKGGKTQIPAPKMKAAAFFGAL